MRLPRLSGREAVSDRLVSFQGINVLDTASQGAFVDMQNLSSDHFPYLSIRKPRGTVQKLTKANGLLVREKMFYVDGTEAFYDGKKVGDVTDSEKTLLSMGAYILMLTKANGLLVREKMFYVDGTEAFYDGKKVGDVTDSEKTLLSMGAYILIFPDKISYNTADGKWERMENSYTSTGTVTYKQSYLTETDLDPEGQVYVKIEAAGIEEGFAEGDGIELSGFNVEVLNKTAVIKDIGTGYIKIVGPIDKEAAGIEEGFAEGDGIELSGFNVEVLNKTAVIKDIGTGYIKIVGPIDKDGSQTEPIAIKRTVPDMDFYTVSENRLWGCSSKNHEIYASKPWDFKNFNCIEGGPSDSYGVKITSDGDFTGAITYLGYVMFWKENAVYKVYGNRPSNFQIVEGMLRGVAKGCGRSLCIVNEVLYYKSESSVMSFQGALPTDVGAVLEASVMSFQGALPTDVGAVLEAGYGEAEAGRMGNKYYISMEKGIFVYDTAKGLWHREDDTKGAGSGIRRSRSGKDGKQILYFHGEGDFCLRHGKGALAPGGRYQREIFFHIRQCAVLFGREHHQDHGRNGRRSH